MTKKKRDDSGQLRDWKRRGSEAAYFQREAQVNLWTLMGGLAAGALLTQVSALNRDIRAGSWHLLLYAASTLLIIVNSWVQSAWGSLALRWRLTAYGTLIYFLSLFCLSLISLAVRQPALWMAAVGAQLIVAQGIQIYFARSGSWALYTPERIRSFCSLYWLYTFWLLMVFGAAAQMRWLPSRISEIVWGFIALVSAAVALHLQHRGMEAERRELGIP